MKLLSRAALTGLVIDVVVLLVFVVVGRLSHGEDATVLGILSTFWPFAVGLAVGWAIGRVWHHPFAIVWGGIIAWLATLVIGMILRLVSGQGIEPGFVIVATLFLALFLLGWRALALLIVRRNAQSSTSGSRQN